jgi:phosphoadenosine phosphosulfate reductase
MDFFEGAEYLEEWETPEILRWAWDTFGERAAIGTSFQGAGLVIMHLSRELGLKFPVFTLDTGLLFPETVELHRRLEEFLGIRIEALKPDFTVEDQARHFGPELWKTDPDQCCTLRKVIPLQAKLQTLDCWMTGLRREQSAERGTTGVLEVYGLADGRQIAKLNPLARWSRDAVWTYLREHKIPYNPLHDRGYRSIGCVPCTAATGGAGGERAGRWTGFSKTECGIHTFLDRKASTFKADADSAI